MTIEIVIYPLKMVIFHSYVTVYQRLLYVNGTPPWIRAILLRADPATIHSKMPRPHGTINHTSIRVSFRVYISYNRYTTWTLQTRQKSEKRDKADTHEVRRGFTFPTDFSKKKCTWNIVTQRCTKVIKHCACAVKWASFKTSRIPFRANPQSLPEKKHASPLLAPGSWLGPSCCNSDPDGKVSPGRWKRMETETSGFYLTWMCGRNVAKHRTFLAAIGLKSPSEWFGSKCKISSFVSGDWAHHMNPAILCHFRITKRRISSKWKDIDSPHVLPIAEWKVDKCNQWIQGQQFEHNTIVLNKASRNKGEKTHVLFSSVPSVFALTYNIIHGIGGNFPRVFGWTTMEKRGKIHVSSIQKPLSFHQKLVKIGCSSSKLII